MPGSIDVALRDAVTSALATHLAQHEDFNGTTAAEDEVEVSYAYKSDSTAAQRVYTGNSEAETPPHAMKSGRNFRNEDGTLDLIVRVQVPGGDIRDADLRAMAICQELEEWVADHKNAAALAAAGVSIPGLISLTARGWQNRTGADDSGAGALRILRIGWTARLT